MYITGTPGVTGIFELATWNVAAGCQSFWIRRGPQARIGFEKESGKESLIMVTASRLNLENSRSHYISQVRPEPSATLRAGQKNNGDHRSPAPLRPDTRESASLAPADSRPVGRFRTGRVPAGLTVSKINTARLVKPGSPWSYPLKKAQLPLCSFGPGGDYIVDWYPQNYRPTIFDDQPAQPRQVMGRFALLMAELRDWLLGIHPGRQVRSESHPDHLEPCAACGQHDSWSPWTRDHRRAEAGLPAAAYRSVSVQTTADSVVPTGLGATTEPAAAVAALANHLKSEAQPELATPAERPIANPEIGTAATIISECPAVAAPEVGPLEPLKIDIATAPIAARIAAPAPAPIATLKRNPIADLADLIPPSIPFPGPLHLETPHDTHSQTVGGNDRHSQLSPQTGLFADNAGTGRRTGRVQGNSIRTRSGPVRKKAGAAVSTPGTLFDSVTRGEAA